MIDDELAAKLADYEPRSVQVPDVAPLSAQAIVQRARKKPGELDPMQVARHVLDVVSNPDLVMSAINNSSRDIEDAAPEAAQDLRNTTSRALFFLASKAPKESPSAPGMPPLPPPRRDVLRFERYLKAVNDPTSILDDADAGTLAPESVEAVKHVYPKLYETMQADLAGRVENMPKIPYTKKMQISALLGQDMTGTLNPRMALSAQSVYSAAPQQPPAQQQMPVYRAKGLGVSGRSGAETEAWRAAQRGVGSWNKQGGR